MFILDEEMNEIIKEIQQNETNAKKDLQFFSEKLQDIINQSPQQLPIIFIIQRELNQFQNNIEQDLNKREMHDKNDFATKNSIDKIKHQSEKIYNIFNKMYYNNFLSPILNLFPDEDERPPIINIIDQATDLLKLTEKDDKIYNSNELEWKNLSNKNTPKYWPLRIREALIFTFKFDVEQKYNEAIEYFETNLILFIFISKLRRTCINLCNAYDLLFPGNEKNEQSLKIPKSKRKILDAYVNRLLDDLTNPKSCSRFIKSLESNVNFDLNPK